MKNINRLLLTAGILAGASMLNGCERLAEIMYGDKHEEEKQEQKTLIEEGQTEETRLFVKGTVTDEDSIKIEGRGYRIYYINDPYNKKEYVAWLSIIREDPFNKEDCIEARLEEGLGNLYLRDYLISQGANEIYWLSDYEKCSQEENKK